MPSKTELDTLRYLSSLVKPKLRPEADKAMKLYNDKSIVNYKTILKIISQLSGRGGSQSSAIKAIEKYEQKPSSFKVDLKSTIKNMFAKGKTLMMKKNEIIKEAKKIEKKQLITNIT